MGLARNVWQWLRSLGRRSALERGLDDEMRFHVDRQIEKYVAAGMAPDEARRQALIRFGAMQGAKDATRDQFRPPRLENLARDFRFSARALLRAPGFTAVAVLTLGLGIGTTTAMFSVVNGVLLNPLPYPEQDRLVNLVHDVPGVGVNRMLGSPAVYFAYRDYSQAFDVVGHWDGESSVTVTGNGEPESVPGLGLTHEVLPLLGAQPIFGRSFRAGDDVPGAAPTAIISFGYAQRRFGGTRAIGQHLVVEGVVREIIGVLPQTFRFVDASVDIYYPLRLVRADAQFPSGDGRGIARLKPGVTLAQANADIRRIVPIMAKEFGDDPQVGERSGFRPTLESLKEAVVGDLGTTLWLMLGTIALLMLIACAKVANLMLVRAHTRRPELILRAALGAGRAAIARVVFTESALVGLAGGMVGLLLAYASLPALTSLGEAELPGVMAIRLDPIVLVVAFASAFFATVLFSFVAVAQLAWPRLRLATALQAGRSMAGTRESNRARHVLVVAQVAIALVLLIGSGLMIRTSLTMRNVDPGFADPDRVLTFQLSLPEEAIQASDDTAVRAARTRLLREHQAIHARLSEVPGVESVGFASNNDPLPLDGDGRQMSMVPIIDGRQVPDGAPRVWEQQRVAPGFFETMRTPIVAGRAIDWNDVLERRQVVMVSESVARKEWGSAAGAIGHRMGPDPEIEVIGVIKDVYHNGVHRPVTDTVGLTAIGVPTATYVVRSPRVGSPDFIRHVREAIWAVNPNVSPSQIRTLGDLYTRSMARTSMTLLLLAITGAMALVLGLIGIYGVVSYAASQRRREIGVRLALGAGRGDVRRMFVRNALMLVTVGVALGLVASAALTRLMESQLFGVTPLDPATHATVALGLAVTASLASYVSAMRGTSVDPTTVLRGD
jgi:putative ABC transport system permease protein